MPLIFGKKCYQLGKLLQKTYPMVPKRNTFYSTNHGSVSYVCSEKNPEDQTKNDLGLFYNISNTVALDTLFSSALLRDYKEECKTFRETRILIRKPALEIINCLKNADYSTPINKFVLYGKHGSGKSMTMCHVIHYAFLSKWLIVHVPSILDWLFATKEEKVECVTAENLMDLPTINASWLTHFKKQNEGLINYLNLKIDNDYKWNIKEENKKGESLLNLVNHGIGRTKYSCDVIKALLIEIKTLSKKGEIKTLVAIDGYDTLFQTRTKIKARGGKLLTPNEISCMEDFRDLAKADWHNGAALLTCDTRKSFNNVDDFLPLKLLGTKGLDFLDPFIPIEVPPLSEKEIKSVLNYYKSKKWILRSDGDNELLQLCGGNHLMLNRLCRAI